MKYVSAIVAGHAREVIAGSIRDAALWEVTIEKVTGKAKAKQPFFGKSAAQTK